MNDKEFNIFGISETNWFWANMPQGDSLYECTRGWWEALHTSVGYNTVEKDQFIFQPGGTAILTKGEPVSRIMKSGSNSHRMGRWCWTKYRVKDEMVVRIVMVYRVGKSNPNPTATLTAYSQQRWILNDENEDRSPQEVMIEDLCIEVKKWKKMENKL